MLSEEGADFISEEVGGAQDEEDWECPREGLRERDVADEQAELPAVHAGGIRLFCDDPNFVVAGRESRDAGLPASIGEFLDFGCGGFEGSPHGLEGLRREVLWGRQGAIERIFVEEALSLLRFELDDELDGFGAVVAPGNYGSSGAAGWEKRSPMKFRFETVGEVPRHALAECFLLFLGEDYGRRGGWRSARSGRGGWGGFRCGRWQLDIGFPWDLKRRKAIGLCDQKDLS
jgi:hypothetical protein